MSKHADILVDMHNGEGTTMEPTRCPGQEQPYINPHFQTTPDHKALWFVVECPVCGAELKLPPPLPSERLTPIHYPKDFENEES